MVMTAMPLSFVSCTRSVIEELLLFEIVIDSFTRFSRRPCRSRSPSRRCARDETWRRRRPFPTLSLGDSKGEDRFPR